MFCRRRPRPVTGAWLDRYPLEELRAMAAAIWPDVPVPSPDVNPMEGQRATRDHVPELQRQVTVPFGDLCDNRPISCPHCELAIDASTFEAELRRLEQDMKRRFK
jgi:hypothetical protein